MSQIDDRLNFATLQPPAAKLPAKPGLRTSGFLGQWPLIGLIIFLFGLIVFAALAVNIQANGPVVQVDTQISNDIHTAALQSPPLIRDVMIVGFYVGEQLIVVIGGLLALYYLLKRYWTELLMVLIAWLGEGGIWLFLAQHFNRPRPAFAVPVWQVLPPPSFPSGHSFASVICFGFLAYIFVPKIGSRLGKALVIVAAVLLILYVGFSRLFLGQHFPTDVLAGYALGISLFGLVYTGVEYAARKIKERRVEHPA